MKHYALAVFLLSAIAGGAAAASGCGDASYPSFFEWSADAGADAPDPVVFLLPTGPYSDFPPNPIIDGADPDAGTGAAPGNSPTLFGAAVAASAGGPCLMEPEIGAMYPRNWLRPRFRWIPFGGLADDPGAPSDAGGAGDAGAAENLFEIRVHADNQVNDLVVYTESSHWTMPKTIWNALRIHSAGVPMTLTMRGGVYDGTTLTQVAVGASGPIHIAPVDAPGAVVYWTTTSGGPGFDPKNQYNPALKGFHIGDESVVLVLTPAMMNGLAGDAGSYHCLGCHTSTPDGNYVSVSARDHNPGGPPTNIALFAADGSAAPPPPNYLSPVAQTLLNRVEQDNPQYSKGHFQSGDRVAVTMYSPDQHGPFDIAWTDMEATSPDGGWGVFARTGDTNHAALATVSHDGTTIAYVSTPDTDTAGTTPSNGDIYTIPWNNRQGGAATALAGASDPAYLEAFPAFSPDDKLLAFTRDPPNTTTYDNSQEEAFVVPAQGGTPTRLAANDAPACAGIPAPRGLYNSWPKWSPSVQQDSAGNSYYFVVFSSQRDYGTKRFGARLYVTAIVIDSGGTMTTYPALYLWNQPENEDNHTPAWDEFAIPPAPVLP